MARLYTPLALAAILASSPAALSAQGNIPSVPVQTPGAVLQCRGSQLEGHTFQVNGLLVTVLSYGRGHGLGGTSLRFHFENPSTQFITIAWQDLAVIGADGEQFIAHTPGNQESPVIQVRIAPGAHITQGLFFDGSATRPKLPAKLYFQEQLLAEFTD